MHIYCTDSVQFITCLGMKETWQFRDVYGLDPELLSMVPRPVCALLLLFPVTEKVTAFLGYVCLCYMYHSYNLSRKSPNRTFYLSNSVHAVHDVCQKRNFALFYVYVVWDIQARRGRKTEEAAAGSVTWCLLHQANYWECLWNNRINSCGGQQPETLGIWWEFFFYFPHSITTNVYIKNTCKSLNGNLINRQNYRKH